MSEFFRMPEIMPVYKQESLLPKEFLLDVKKGTTDVTAGLLEKWKLAKNWEFEVHPLFGENKIETKFAPLPEKEVEVSNGGLLSKVEEFDLSSSADVEIKEEEGAMTLEESTIPQAISLISTNEAHDLVIQEESVRVQSQKREMQKPAIKVLELIANYQVEHVYSAIAEEVEIKTIPSIVLQKIESVDVAKVKPEKVLEAIAATELVYTEEVEEQIETIVKTIDVQFPELLIESELPAVIESTVMEPIKELPVIEEPLPPAYSRTIEFVMLPSIKEVVNIEKESVVTPQTFSEMNMNRALGSLGSVGLTSSNMAQSPMLVGNGNGGGYSALPLAV